MIADLRSIRRFPGRALVPIVYTYRASASEATVKRLNALFGNWQPPKGYKIKAHYSYADGTGGLTWSRPAPRR